MSRLCRKGNLDTNRHHEKAKYVDYDLKRQHPTCKMTNLLCRGKCFLFSLCYRCALTWYKTLFLDVWGWFFPQNTFCVLMVTILHQGSIDWGKKKKKNACTGIRLSRKKCKLCPVSFDLVHLYFLENAYLKSLQNSYLKKIINNNRRFMIVLTLASSLFSLLSKSSVSRPRRITVYKILWSTATHHLTPSTILVAQ